MSGNCGISQAAPVIFVGWGVMGDTLISMPCSTRSVLSVFDLDLQLERPAMSAFMSRLFTAVVEHSRSNCEVAPEADTGFMVCIQDARWCPQLLSSFQ